MYTLHGVQLSQPFRSIAWVLLQKKVPFQCAMVIPGSTGKMGSKAPPYLELSPTGMVPMLQDGALCLSESPAILEYLCTKHGWEDLYPTDPAQRAKLSAAMHWCVVVPVVQRRRCLVARASITAVSFSWWQAPRRHSLARRVLRRQGATGHEGFRGGEGQGARSARAG